MEEMKGYSAVAKYLPMSSSKIRPIADNIRRMPYTEAVAILESLPHKGARFLRKAIQSAAANAMNTNKALDESVLYIKELLVDEGPSRTKIWPRSRGRADRLIKRTSHISVTVGEIGKAGE